MDNACKERLNRLRKAMKKKGITAFYITTADYHGSEYVHDYFKVRQYFSGFTGSNGNLLVLKDSAILWTDGRYFVQAEDELSGSGIELYKMGEAGVPDVFEFLENNLGKKDVLGFDGRTISATFGKKLKESAEKAGFSLKYKEDITSDIFKRPDFPMSKGRVLPTELTGEDTASKLGRLREELKKAGAEAVLYTSLDSIMYLFNLRGNDVENNPVLMSYAYVSEDISVIFLQQEAVTDEMKRALDGSDTMIMDYWGLNKFINGLQPGTKILADPNRISYYLYRKLKKDFKLISGSDPAEMMKAVKNETEIGNMRKICLKDSVALTRFMLEFKTRMENERFTELSAAELLLDHRREIPEFKDLSFPTISAYKENAAMMHYDPEKTEETALKQEGMLLIDSGGQYEGGTTDVTRTLVLGELSPEEKKDYTLTAVSMLNLMHVRWLSGCTGRNIDIIARKRMWDEGMDYKCGTGHGVGYMLNVHEGPHGIRWQKNNGDAVLKPGMFVTDEPGVYKKGKHGIRIENLLLVKNDIKTDDGQFLCFDCFTHVPIDDRGIDRSLMTERELSYYLEYQRSVQDTLSPYLSDEEKEKLEKYTGV